MESLFYFLNEGLVRVLHTVATIHPFGAQVVFFAAETFPLIIIVAVVVFGVCSFFAHDRRMVGAASAALAAAVLAWGVSHILKWWFATSRPHVVLETITPVFQHEGAAFPSGHASFFFALALMLWQADRRLGVVGIFAAVCISIARVAAGVHWPIDIVGGFIVGCAAAYATYTGIRIGTSRGSLHSR